MGPTTQGLSVAGQRHLVGPWLLSWNAVQPALLGTHCNVYLGAAPTSCLRSIMRIWSRLLMVGLQPEGGHTQPCESGSAAVRPREMQWNGRIAWPGGLQNNTLHFPIGLALASTADCMQIHHAAGQPLRPPCTEDGAVYERQQRTITMKHILRQQNRPHLRPPCTQKMEPSMSADRER